MNETYVSRIMDGIIAAKTSKEVKMFKNDLDEMVQGLSTTLDAIEFNMSSVLVSEKYNMSEFEELRKDHNVINITLEYIKKLYQQADTKYRKLQG